MLVSWLQGRTAVTEPNWLLLFGPPRERLHAALLFAMVAMGCPRSLCLALGFGWVSRALVLTEVVTVMPVPKLMRLS